MNAFTLDAAATAWASCAFSEAHSQTMNTDVLVLGAGMAGLRAAVRARELGRRVAIAYEGRGASPFIIGCNAPFAHADSSDSIEKYAADVVAGGCGLSDQALVDVLTRQAMRGVRELVEIGAPIARDGEHFRQRQLSGNWYPRSIYHPDGLGAQAIPALSAYAKRIGVQVLPGHQAVRLLVDGDRVCGALLRVKRNGTWVPVVAHSVVMALGGLGRLYHDSTYPSDVEASSYALGYQVGAPLVDMEFVQFEPLCTYMPTALKGLELPTSMLVEGAHLLNSNGERFMFRHNPEWGEGRIEKAKLSLCIQQEIDEGRGVDGGVIYDATRVPADIIEGYRRHCARLRKAGLDPLALRVPVRPAAHSQMGGLWIDENAATLVPGLYAAGEAAGGLHGASRIAGNGGADALVFGDIAGASAARHDGPSPDSRGPVNGAFQAIAAVGSTSGKLDAREAKYQIRRAVSTGAGLYRTDVGLRLGMATLSALTERIQVDFRLSDDASRAEASAALGMARIGSALMAAALARTESRGAHQRRDYPQTVDSWRKHVVIGHGVGNEMKLRIEPVQ